MSPRPLKIAFVTPYDLGMAGGVNVHIRWLTRALHELGHDTRVYGPTSLPDLLAPGEAAVGRAIPITAGGIVAGMSVNPLLGRKVRAIIERERFDIINCHEPLTFMPPWLFNEQAREVPLVGTFHVHREDGHWMYAWFKWFLNRFANRLDHRIAISDVARDTAARYFPGHYDVIPNGVDVRRFRDAIDLEPEKAAAAPDGAATILFVGRLEPRKGLRYLIEAMPLVRERVPAARLVVVGDGPTRTDDEALARAMPDGAVRFLGSLENGKLPALYRGADVVCSPATHGESFGIVLLEAMAAERAIVASRLEGFDSLVEGGRLAELVPPREPAALADALVDVLTDHDRRLALGARAGAAAAPYDWSVIAQRVEEIFRAVIARRAAR
jgi:phosphatidyl-myo-inositol alpha-mannosyltransferase